MTKTALHLSAILSKVHNRNLIMRKTRKTILGNILYDTWTIFLKTVKVMKKKETDKLLQTKGDRGDMTTKCNVVPWTGSWNRKKAFIERLVKSK